MEAKPACNSLWQVIQTHNIRIRSSHWSSQLKKPPQAIARSLLAVAAEFRRLKIYLSFHGEILWNFVKNCASLMVKSFSPLSRFLCNSFFSSQIFCLFHFFLFQLSFLWGKSKKMQINKSVRSQSAGAILLLMLSSFPNNKLVAATLITLYRSHVLSSSSRKMTLLFEILLNESVMNNTWRMRYCKSKCTEKQEVNSAVSYERLRDNT